MVGSLGRHSLAERTERKLFTIVSEMLHTWPAEIPSSCRSASNSPGKLDIVGPTVVSY